MKSVFLENVATINGCMHQTVFIILYRANEISIVKRMAKQNDYSMALESAKGNLLEWPT